MLKPKVRKIARRPSVNAAASKEGMTTASSAWVDKQHAGFARSLRNLGIPEAQQILAQLQRFMQEVRQDTPIKELREVWDYKPIQGEPAKKQKLMQIKPLRNYRVLLTLLIDESTRCVWFLEVHRRGSNDDEYRDSAIRRAQAIRNQREES